MLQGCLGLQNIQFFLDLKTILTAVKCNSTELATKSISDFLVVSGFAYAHVWEFHVLFVWGTLACTLNVRFQCCLRQPIVQAVFPNPSLLFPLLIQCVCLSCVGAHGWIARIFQPWYTLPLSVWISEKPLDVARANSPGKLNYFCNQPTSNNRWCFLRTFHSFRHSSPSSLVC